MVFIGSISDLEDCQVFRLRAKLNSVESLLNIQFNKDLYSTDSFH